MHNAMEKANQELVSRFSTIAQNVDDLLEGLSPQVEYQYIRWFQIPLTLNQSRFGVNEIVNTTNEPELLVSKELLKVQDYLLKWVLWREAILAYLCRRVRLVPEAADLGLYGGLKYGIKNPHNRQRLQQIWETVSPAKDYGFYRYFPTAGFAIFDNVADGAFLQRVIPWLNKFCDAPALMTTSAFTSGLERWMFDYHRNLKPAELRVLTALSQKPEISQAELAERVGLRQPSVSRILKTLANKHLLRLLNFVNPSVMGLKRMVVTFYVPNLRILFALKKLLVNIRYTLAIQDFNRFLLCGFAIPTRRISRFRQWAYGITKAWDLPSPVIRSTIERSVSWNFPLYVPKLGGWPLDYESILDNVARLIREEWTHMMPPLRSFRYSESAARIKLQPEDFVYMQRATDVSILTDRVRSSEAQEARLAGFRESEHMAYRRRVQFLEDVKLISPPLGITLFHIGLNAIISLWVEGTKEENRRVLTALQLLPNVYGTNYDDESSSAVLLVPKSAAVAIETSLRDLLIECGINAVMTVNSTWDVYGGDQVAVNIRNYNFDNGTWLWTKDTLPMGQPLEH